MSIIHMFHFPIGSALDLNFSDINVASLDKELEEQDHSVGMTSKDLGLFFWGHSHINTRM